MPNKMFEYMITMINYFKYESWDFMKVVIIKLFWKLLGTTEV